MALRTRFVPRFNALKVCGAASALALLGAAASAASAGTFNVAPLSGDADSQIDTSRVYTHRFDLGSDDGGANVNGVALPAGGVTGPGYTLTGTDMTFQGNGASFGNDLPPASGVFDLTEDFHFSSAIGAGVQTFTLTGLTPGTQYRTSFYAAGFSGANQTITASDDATASLTTDRGDEKIIQYTYTANASSITYTIDADDNANAFHHLGFTNEVLSPVAARSPIPVFNSGVTSANNPDGTNGTVIGAGTTDTHFTVDSPGDPVSFQPAIALNDQGAYFNGGGNSIFINPTGSGQTSLDPGTYTYRTTFTLDGSLDPATAEVQGRVLTDDSLADILINGQSTGITGTGFGEANFTNFVISDGFLSGVNTIDFLVVNGGTAGNPTGFRLDLFNGSAALIPEPASLALLGLGGLGLLARRRRRA